MQTRVFRKTHYEQWREKILYFLFTINFDPFIYFLFFIFLRNEMKFFVRSRINPIP